MITITGGAANHELDPTQLREGRTPGPPGGMNHVVQFYEDDAFLCDTVARFVGAGVAAGEPVLIIATDVHRHLFLQRLKANHVDVERAIADGGLVLLDARETLARILEAGMPDWDRFKGVVGGVLDGIARTGQARAYGEMVDLLWRDGNAPAALRLEEMWNDLGQEYRFSLLCAYVMGNFYQEDDAASFARVCRAHSHVVPSEGYSGLADPHERMREVSLLQQRACALKTEVHRRQEVEARLSQLLSEQTRAGAQSRERFRLLIESVRDYAVLMLSPSGHISSWNPGAERIKGYTSEEIIGRHFSQFYPEDDVKAGKCERELEVAAREGRFEEEGWRVRKDGSRFWANVVINAVCDQGKLVGFAKVTRDLTDRKRVQDEQTARLAAEQANRAKDEFLAMLGHELRNPLSPIVTALQIMKLRDPAQQAAKELQVIERQVHHMVRLVDDLLDVSRIARGKVELKKHRITVQGVIARAIEMAAPLLEQRSHRVEVDVPSREILVDADEARLAQVVSNLLTNAAKFTDPEGRIQIRARTSGRDVLLEVEDNGIGISPALLPAVFDLFVQGEQSAERSRGGLGLGLALVRALVEMHGGQVEARSEGMGKGSTFSVRLPRAMSPASEQSASPAVSIAGTDTQARRILLVDDNEDARDLLAEFLRMGGHDVRTACDGPTALDVLHEFEPEVAVLDIGLPVMDGYELASRLRESLGEATPRLIALTGYGQKEDRARSQRAGFDAHIVKPVDLAALTKFITREHASRP